MPVTGPFYRTVETASMRKTQRWYCQPAPYQKPLQYDMDVYGPLPGAEAGVWWKSWSWDVFNYDPRHWDRLVMRAREQLRDSCTSTAQVGVALAEWRQSLSMVESRAIQLWQLARAIRRGRPGDAYKALRLDPKKSPTTTRGRAKNFGNSWLEWHFGWTPLIGDIYDAIDVVQNPIPDNLARGSARTTAQWTSTTPYIRSRYSLDYRVRMGARVELSNPNLYLANQLGLVNPASVAWELVPFSFCVDWFLPVGKFLAQFSDFIGLTLHDSYTTRFGTMTVHEDGIEPYSTIRQYRYRTQMERRGGIAGFSLRPTGVPRVSAARAATAISLLLQQLKG